MTTITRTDGSTWVKPPARSYAELRQLARQQLENRIGYLEERAEFLQEFLDRFDGVESPDDIAALAHETNAYMDDDHLVPAIETIIHEWPHVARQADYW